MQVLNASHVDLVAGGGKSVDPAAEPTPPLVTGPRPWPWFPVEP